MKYIERSAITLQEKKKTRCPASDEEPSLLERVLENESDPKIACIMALDLILVGIDTVCRKFQFDP